MNNAIDFFVVAICNYKEIKAKGVEIKVELRTEPWEDRHFAIQDPNAIGIDIVTYTQPEE